jgi:AcrR family transcriptional regulator
MNAPQATRAGERPGRRARKKERTRREIFAAAVRLFLERGYDAVTVDDICRAADVARGTFFLHFPTKDTLLAEYGREATADLAARMHDHRGDATAELRAMFRLLAERAIAHGDVVRLTVREVMARPLGIAEATEQARDVGMLLAAVVRRGQSAGELRRDVAPEVAGAVLVSAYFAIVNVWATGPEKFDLTAAVEQMLDLVLNGLARPPARRRPSRRHGGRP